MAAVNIPIIHINIIPDPFTDHHVNKYILYLLYCRKRAQNNKEIITPDNKNTMIRLILTFFFFLTVDTISRMIE